jgi:peptidoglycan hydrolase-like protein with peptidoglycan-binding domain
LTGVLEVGAVADRGSVLYAADTEPVAALLAPDALFRDLNISSTDGDDIKALEENLSAFGLGANLTIDRNFDSATASAVKKWEEALGRQEPDGVVSVGEVVFLPEPAAVISRRAGVGDRLNIGTPVLTLGTKSMVVKAKVDVQDRAKWATGTVVRLDWADQPGTGTVIEVGRDEAGGQVEVTIALGAGAPSVPVGTQVDASATTAQQTGVVAVPVSAIVEGPDGPAVRTEKGALVPVKLGMVSGGLAEITKGLEDGARVRLPG